MKIRTLQQLSNFLDEELVWRKREITNAHFLVDKSKKHEKPLLLRLSICLLYAHWEGFIKRATKGYLNYVSMQGCKYDDLCIGLLAFSMRSQHRVVEDTEKVGMHTKITEFYIYGLQDSAVIPWEDAVKTDNLKWQVLQDTLGTVGLPFVGYATKKALIDDKLVYLRNNIAHGTFMEIDEPDYEALHQIVLELLEQFRTDLENAASTKQFLRHPPVS